MASTAVMAILGFVFWTINARIFSADEVGIGTTLISVMTLISSFCLFGLGSSLVKYLPTSDKKNETINSSFMIVILTSVVAALGFLYFLKTFSPALVFIRENLVYAFIFVIFIVFASLNTLSENVFIAYRSSRYVFIKNVIFSIVKLLLPFVLIVFGAYGIFMAFGFAVAVAFIFGLIFLVLNFNYLIKPVINSEVVRQMAKFSLSNYAAGFIGGLPGLLLPLIITNSIGSRFSAYYYMDMMIANILYVIPIAASQSLFAEGALAEIAVRLHLTKTIKIISLLLIPAIILTFLFGKYILLIFGKNYSTEGMLLLQLLSFSAIFISISTTINVILNIRHKMKLLLVLNLLGTAVILTLSLDFIRYNLMGLGWGWLIGQGIEAAIGIIIVWKYKLL
jgi:O-antigen/teichoic acid export membrane protein